MAQYVYQFTTTVPAGTTKAAPLVAPITLDGWDIESIDLEVPPGPAGLAGFYVENNGVQWIPFSPGEWIVWDDRFDSWYFTDQPNASGWAVVAYNTDVFDHDVVLRFHVNSAIASVPAAPVIVSPTFVTSGLPLPEAVLVG